MRAPRDVSRRHSRAGRTRIALGIGLVLLVILITSMRGIAGFYTDYLWFKDLGISQVWRGVLGVKILLAIFFTVLFFGLMWVNLWIADRIAPRLRPPGP